MIDKILFMIKENYKKIWFSFLINTVISIIFINVFYIKYHTNDDLFMNMIANGAYGTPDSHIVFINYILGLLLSSLYKFNNVVPWYGLMHISMAICSLSVIMCVLFNKGNKLSRRLSFLAIVIISYEAYTKIQFTKTATYLAVAGYFLIAYSFETNRKTIKQIFGIALIILSFLIRYEQFLCVSAISVGVFIPKLIKWIKNIKAYRNCVVNLFIVGFVSLILVVASYWININAYKSSQWSNYIKYNQVRSDLTDRNFPDYATYGDEYLNLNINQTAYNLYSSFDFYDTDNFNIEKMEAVEKIEEYKTRDYLGLLYMCFFSGVENVFLQKTTGPFSYLIVLCLILYIFNKNKESKELLGIIYSFLISAFTLVYVYFMHNWFDRTTISVLVAFLLVVLYCFQYDYEIKENILVVFVVFVLVVLICFVWSNRLKINQKDNIQQDNLLKEVIEEVSNDKDNIYLLRTCNRIFEAYKPLDSMDLGISDNILFMGGWLASSPLTNRIIDKYGLNNIFKDTINNDNVYLLGNDFDLVIDYMKEYYDENAELVIVKTINGINISKVISNQ